MPIKCGFEIRKWTWSTISLVDDWTQRIVNSVNRQGEVYDGTQCSNISMSNEKVTPKSIIVGHEIYTVRISHPNYSLTYFKNLIITSSKYVLKGDNPWNLV
jgi:hypothetical protein